MTTQPPDIMTYKEVAEYLRIADLRNPRRTIARYVRLGRLKSFTVSNKIVRFRRKDVEAFVAELVEEQKVEKQEGN